MKFGIIFCVLAMLVSCEVAGQAFLQGNCSREDVTPKYLTYCAYLHCTKSENGTITVAALPCAKQVCDSPTDETLLDLTKTYPDCCPQPVC